MIDRGVKTLNQGQVEGWPTGPFPGRLSYPAVTCRSSPRTREPANCAEKSGRQGRPLLFDVSLALLQHKLTQDVREYAAKQRVEEVEALQRGIEERAIEFVNGGEEVNRNI